MKYVPSILVIYVGTLRSEFGFLSMVRAAAAEGISDSATSLVAVIGNFNEAMACCAALPAARFCSAVICADSDVVSTPLFRSFAAPESVFSLLAPECESVVPRYDGEQAQRRDNDAVKNKIKSLFMQFSHLFFSVIIR